MIATGSEKAGSELIISPILVEVRKILQRQVSLFSGAEFTVEPASGLSGVCDFLISRSPEQLEIEAPAVAASELVILSTNLAFLLLSLIS